MLRWRAVAQVFRYQVLAKREGSSLLVIDLQTRDEGGVVHAEFALASLSNTPVVYHLQVQALPGAGQVDYVAGVPSAVVDVTITSYSTAAEMAAALNALHIEGSQCGTRLLAAFPALTPNTLASAMAQGGYAAQDTSQGLMAVWPKTSPLDLAAALAFAYSGPVDWARRMFAQGVPATECASQLVQRFKSLTLSSLANALAQGGYASLETSKALLAVWPGTPPLELAAALALAYPDPVQFAASQYAQGITGEACAVNLLKAFPQLGAAELASAMAKAGYLVTDTATGLRAAFSDISPAELSTALVSAYR
ncbi:hypothetical protein D3C79_509770 [compost metagenome]